LFDRLEAPKNRHKSFSGGHGRVETRRCAAIDIAERGLVETEGWSKMRTVFRVEAERWKEGETTTETRYFISSLEPDVERLLEATRTYWHIENKLRWVLDVAFEEDESRIREGHAAQNMAALRRLARSLLENETTSSVGVKNKRLQAALDEDYLLNVLRGTPN
jgi:predicted transposase YbfD/YdcC